MTQKNQRAWSQFWAEGRNSRGCLPARWEMIDRAQRQCWTRFAGDLPRRARCLDVATGDGRVLSWMREVRPDLNLRGVDSAPQLPPSRSGIKLKAGVAMEDMPYGDASFDAATSQFGFEYGDIRLASSEIARILKPGGQLALMTHRNDGPILAHNLARREEIRWALETRQLVSIAKRSLALRTANLAIVPPEIRDAPGEGARRFGQGSAAWEIAEAVRQTLSLGQRDSAANVAALLEQIAGQAANEVGRINSLEQACRTTADASAFEAVLREAGFEPGAVETLTTRQGERPFADFRTYRRLG